MLPFLIPAALTTKKAAVTGITGALVVAMAFTPEGATALALAITAGAGLVAALFTGLVNLIKVLRETKTKVEENTAVVVEAAKTNSAVLAKTEQIHGATIKIESATNGTLHTLEGMNQVLQQKVDGLETLVASMIAGAKSQAAAVTEAGKLTPPAGLRRVPLSDAEKLPDPDYGL